MRVAQGRPDGVVVRARRVVVVHQGDVRADGIFEDEGGLRDERDVTGECTRGEVTKVDAVDFDAARGRVGEPGEEGDERALASAG